MKSIVQVKSFLRDSDSFYFKNQTFIHSGFGDTAFYSSHLITDNSLSCKIT